MLSTKSLLLPFLDVPAVTTPSVHVESFKVMPDVSFELEAFFAEDRVIFGHAIVASVGCIGQNVPLSPFLRSPPQSLPLVLGISSIRLSSLTLANIYLIC